MGETTVKKSIVKAKDLGFLPESLYYIKRKMKFALPVLGQDRRIANRILLQYLKNECISSGRTLKMTSV